VELSEVVPWGRTLSEYKEMFSLTSRDLDKKILGCGDGPASFNAELTAKGGNVISIDPIYQFSPSQIQTRIEDVYPQIMEQVSKNHADLRDPLISCHFTEMGSCLPKLNWGAKDGPTGIDSTE